MNDEIQFSDEFLNAYLDDELNHSDKTRLLDAVRNDAHLNRRLCQLQRVHNMVQLAYHDISHIREEQPQPLKKKNRQPRFATAATILLIAGALGGWFTHNHFNSQPGLTEIVQELRTNIPQAGAPWKLIVQVSTNDANRFNILMDETERLLKTAQQNDEKIFIQILANADGINLLKDDDSPTAIRVRDLNRQYSNNLLLTACGQTLKKLKTKNKGIPKLLSEAKIVHSALQQVIEKQKQGWTYIRI